MADYIRVADANLNGGLLSIDPVREVPEAMKPRRIEIANSNQPASCEKDRGLNAGRLFRDWFGGRGILSCAGVLAASAVPSFAFSPH